MRGISGRAYHAQGKRGAFWGAHIMRKENEGHFGVRMSCWSKTRQVFGAHIMRREKAGHFRGAHVMRRENEGHFGALIVCSGQFSLHFRR
ncbi:hypothetical protein BHU11_01445 [Tannerella sp. oral taxon 808]|nr:hypothetical protein BHU11_01445 [Tannerella sp. oral taxon 808]PNE29389.1 hypothetical protein BHU09_02140 [Tannerella sp. oral taxon 808]